MEDFKSYIGLEVYSPQHFVRVNVGCIEIKMSKWERKLNKMIYKWKLRISILRWVVKIVLPIMLTAISGYLCLLLFVTINSQTQINAILIGIVISLTWILIWIITPAMIETDTDNIRVKHRNKYY